jgi:hypothetical protein
LGRPFVVVHCAGKANRQIYAEAARAFGKDVSDKADAYTAATALYDALLHGARTLVLQMGAYLRKIGPFDAGEAWMDDTSKESGKPTLVPV